MTVPTETQPAGAGVLGDDERAVLVHLGDGEAERPRPVDLLEEAVVAAGGLRAALDDVAGGDGAREPVPVVARPAEAPRRRADHQRRVGDAPGDDDVGAARERLGDAPAAEVGVGGQRTCGRRRAGRLLVEVREASRRRRAARRAAARDRRPRRRPRARARRACAASASARRRGRADSSPPALDDDLDPCAQALGEHLLHLREEACRRSRRARRRAAWRGWPSSARRGSRR